MSQETQRLLKRAGDPEASPQGVMELAKKYPCPACCLGVLLLWAGTMLLIIGIFALPPTPSVCAIEIIRPGDVIKEMAVGTSESVFGPGWPKNRLDMTGLWWIRWNPADSWGIWFYDLGRVEILVATAGVQWVDENWNVRTDFTQPPALFPMWMTLPGAMPRHWGYSNSWFSSKQMHDHANGWAPDVSLTFNFENDSYATIDQIGEFMRLPPSASSGQSDEWLRPNYNRTQNYVLTRIAYEDGSTNPVFWDAYMQAMGWYSIRLWGDTNVCKRRCESTLAMWLFPTSTGCSICRYKCWQPVGSL